MDEGASSSMLQQRPHHNIAPGPSGGRADSKKEPPNLREYERYLSNVTAEIHKTEEALKNLLGSKSSPSGMVGEIAATRDSMRRSRRERDTLRQELTVYQRQSDESKKLLFDKRHEISQVEENYLFFKNEQKLSEQLRRYEASYDNKQFTNIREETAIVQQIDKLRRNQKKLKMWKELCEERDLLESEMKSLRSRMQTCHRKMRDIRQAEDTKKGRLREAMQSVPTKKRELNELFDRKRRLIQEYKEKRQQYLDWQRSHPSAAAAAAKADWKATSKRQMPHRIKPKRKVTTTYSSGGGGYDSESDSEHGDTELFVDEKLACKSLISYLQRLLPSSNPSVLCLTPSSGSCESENVSSNSPSNHASLSNASSLAEEHQQLVNNPENAAGGGGTSNTLVVLRRDSIDESNPDSHGRKKSTKKEKSRKLTQPISYDPQTLGRFDLVGVKAPLTLSEAASAIESLKAQLKFFADHTRMPPDNASSYWFDTFGIRCGTDRMISSESEMTTDSARFSYVTPSDVDVDEASRSYADLLSLAEEQQQQRNSVLPQQPPSSLSLSTESNKNDAEIILLSPSSSSAAGAADQTPVGPGFGGDGFPPPTTTTNNAAASDPSVKTPAENVQVTNEGGGKSVEESGRFSRVPTYDEGFADIATDVMSKDSSTGDSTTGDQGVDAAEMRQRLSRLGLNSSGMGPDI